MKKITTLCILASIGLLFSNFSLAQNMNRWIEMEVKQGSFINIDVWMDEPGTLINVVCGTTDLTMSFDNQWHGYTQFYAGGTTMRIYGDIQKLDCSENGENVTSMDVSNNTGLHDLRCYDNNISSLNVDMLKYLVNFACSKNPLHTLSIKNLEYLEEVYCADNMLTSLELKGLNSLRILNCRSNKLDFIDISEFENLERLFCHDNLFTTAVIDSIYCALPDRGNQGQPGIIQPIFNTESDNYATVVATNDRNAKSKNWSVQYYQDSSPVTTTGGHVFGSSTDCIQYSAITEIYPNPVSDVLYINTTEKIKKIEVYNSTGNLEILLPAAEKNIHLATLPKGIYFLKLTTENGSKTHKICKD